VTLAPAEVAKAGAMGEVKSRNSAGTEGPTTPRDARIERYCEAV